MVDNAAREYVCCDGCGRETTARADMIGKRGHYCVHCLRLGEPNEPKGIDEGTDREQFESDIVE